MTVRAVRGMVVAMPIGYLISVIVAVVGTWFALVPVRLPRALEGVGFLFGPLVNELPFTAFYWLLLWTVLAFIDGDISSPPGWVVVGIAVLAMAANVVVAARGLQAGPAVDQALAEGFGTRQHDDAGTAQAVQKRRNIPIARILIAPLFLGRRDVQRTANVRYGGAGRSNLLDVYRHRSQPSNAPVLIHFHGGHFSSGRKNKEGRPLLYRLASQGWVCISANYRLSPAATFPDFLVDVKKVISWVREHSAEYGADPTMVFVAGSSAGAHLAAMAALTPADPSFQPGFEGADTSVAGAICLYGYYGDLDSDVPSSPIARIGDDVPPFFVAHGANDTLTPVGGARHLVEKLRKASSNPVVFAVLPGGQHTFDLFHSIRFENVINGVEAFTNRVRSNNDPAGPRQPQQ